MGSGDYLKCHLSVYTLINVIFKIEIFNEINFMISIYENEFKFLKLNKTDLRTGVSKEGARVKLVWSRD